MNTAVFIAVNISLKNTFIENNNYYFMKTKIFINNIY